MRLRTVVVSVAVLACPARAAAQTTAPPTVPSANDVWIGSVASSEQETAQTPFGPWLGSAGWSLATSHAWTDHWRTELTVARLGPATGYAELTTPVSPTVTTYRNDQWTVRRTSLAMTTVYQFGHNAWVHPYVATGLDVSREAWTGQEDCETVALVPRNGIPTNVRLSDVGAALPASTQTIVRPVAALGLKVYLARRVYLRGEVRLFGLASPDRLVRQGGAGFDV